MSEEHIFTIPWSVPEVQWEKARAAISRHERGSTYDRRGLGRYYLLYGDVDFTYDHDHFYGDTYGAKGINVSLFDFALALADAYIKQRFAPGETATYDQLDDDLQIHFTGEDEVIRVSASDRPGALIVPRVTFQQGVLSFLCSVASALKQRFEGVMDWESMAPLKEVMVRFCGN